MRRPADWISMLVSCDMVSPTIHIFCRHTTKTKETFISLYVFFFSQLLAIFIRNDPKLHSFPKTWRHSLQKLSPPSEQCT